LILITGRCASQALHVELRMGGTQGALDQRRLQAREGAGAAQ